MFRSQAFHVVGRNFLVHDKPTFICAAMAGDGFRLVATFVSGTIDKIGSEGASVNQACTCAVMSIARTATIA
jgi:hypothetical protein